MSSNSPNKRPMPGSDATAATGQAAASASTTITTATAAGSTTTAPSSASATVQELRQVSTFPLPPMSYVDKFSDEMISRGLEPRPPTPPQLDDPGFPCYRSFGLPHSLDDAQLFSLESQNVQRLYPVGDFSHKEELRKLNFSILANFLDLLQIIVNDPAATAKRQRKLEDLSTLFINMHHLVNENRPNQARDSLVQLMRNQLHVSVKTIETAEVYGRRAMDCVDQAKEVLPDPREAHEEWMALMRSVGVEDFGDSM